MSVAVVILFGDEFVNNVRGRIDIELGTLVAATPSERVTEYFNQALTFFFFNDLLNGLLIVVLVSKYHFLFPRIGYIDGFLCTLCCVLHACHYYSPPRCLNFIRGKPSYGLTAFFYQRKLTNFNCYTRSGEK